MLGVLSRRFDGWLFVVLATVGVNGCGRAPRGTGTPAPSAQGDASLGADASSTADAALGPDAARHVDAGSERPHITAQPYRSEGALDSRAVIGVTVMNRSEGLLLVDAPQFALEYADGRVLPPVAHDDSVRNRVGCAGRVAPSATVTCFLEGTTRTSPVALFFNGISPPIRVVMGSPCALELEGETELSCRDGCDNDGDPYIDCDDRDCCGLASDCGADTFCGGVTEGPENSAAACADSFDNDGDGFRDCEDFDCCDQRECPETSACGRRSSCTRSSEDTADACSDGCSNDGDPYVDCDDRDCCVVALCSREPVCF